MPFIAAKKKKKKITSSSIKRQNKGGFNMTAGP